MMFSTATVALLVTAALNPSLAFVPPLQASSRRPTITFLLQSNNNDKNEEWSDFDGFIGDAASNNDTDDKFSLTSLDKVDTTESEEDDDKFTMTNILQSSSSRQDLSACQARQFVLGEDFMITNFAGSMGFDAVTDWEYFYESEDDPEIRKVVSPPPLDPSKPKRTRESSGSVVRLFRGEFGGRLGATLRAQGLDARVLLKEFSGELALSLAQAELDSIGTLQSNLLKENNVESMVPTALARTTLTRQDDGNLCTLMNLLKKVSFTGVLGEVNIADLLEDDFDKNDWYRAFSVPPPKPDSIWIVYEYTGLSTVASYSVPAAIRVARMPVQKGLFGNVVAPPALPPFQERARYIRMGIIKQALEAVALLHETGITHQSIGKSSLVIGSVALDKNEAASPYSTNLNRIQMKLGDFGFSSFFEDSTKDEGFLSRARSFGLNFKKGESSSATKGFAMAEDLHALGFCVLGLLLSALAQVPSPDYKLPDTDEDTLQRLLTDIFDKDMQQFRDYVEAEEIWGPLVELLDEKDGWNFLEALLFARERAAKDGEIVTARGLLSSPFLQR